MTVLNYIKVSIHGETLYIPLTGDQIESLKSSKASTVSLQIKVDVEDRTGILTNIKVWQ